MPPASTVQRTHIGADSPIARRAAPRHEKKPCSREGTGSDRMEQSYSRVDACRPLPTTNSLPHYLSNSIAIWITSAETIATRTTTAVTASTVISTSAATVVIAATAASQPGPLPRTSPDCNPLLSRARIHGSRAICIAFTTYCFTALPRSKTAANCHQRYGSKQRGGRPRRWARCFVAPWKTVYAGRCECN